MADKVWHCISDEGELGPFSQGQILGMYVDGEISAETAVWKNGMASWEPLKFHLDDIGGGSHFTKHAQHKPKPELSPPARETQTAKLATIDEEEPSYFFLRLIRVFVAFIAFWQIIGLLPAFAWLGHLDQVSFDMWFRVAIKLFIAIACFSISERIRRFINFQNERQFGRIKIKSWNSL